MVRLIRTREITNKREPPKLKPNRRIGYRRYQIRARESVSTQSKSAQERNWPVDLTKAPRSAPVTQLLRSNGRGCPIFFPTRFYIDLKKEYNEKVYFGGGIIKKIVSYVYIFK